MAPAARAHSILYALTLHANSGTMETLTYATDSFGQIHLVSDTTQSAAGDIFHGLFAIDSSILAVDGTQQQGEPLIFFTLKIADDIWSYRFPFNNSFDGFRGPGDFSYEPGFDIVNGTLVGMCGGVYGPGDIPFVDFAECTDTPYPPYQNGFGAVGIPFIHSGTSSYPNGVFGTFDVTRVPEPSALALLSIGLVGVAISRRRRRLVRWIKNFP